MVVARRARRSRDDCRGRRQPSTAAGAVSLIHASRPWSSRSGVHPSPPVHLTNETSLADLCTQRNIGRMIENRIFRRRRAWAPALAACLACLALAAPAGARAVWHPRPGTTWQWQLTGKVDTSVPARMYDIDLFDNPASVVRSLHARGRRVV